MPKLELTSQQRRDLRAAAHTLRPVVLIGERGLSPAVLAEIDRHVTAHELIKIRVADADRENRDSMLEEICTALSCAAVHHIGKTLIIYRPNAAAAQTAPTDSAQGKRKKSDPYVPKKRAARGSSSRTNRPARQPAAKAPAQPAAGSAPGRANRRPAAAPLESKRGANTQHGIRRRGTGSALSLRAGIRRRKTGQ